MRRRCLLAWLFLFIALLAVGRAENEDDEDQYWKNKSDTLEGSGSELTDTESSASDRTPASGQNIETGKNVRDDKKKKEDNELPTVAHGKPYSNTVVVLFSLGCVVLAVVALIVFLVSYFRDKRPDPTPV